MNTNKKDIIEEISTHVLFTGKLFEIVRKKFKYDTDGNSGYFEAEIAIRTPGVRLLITKNNKFLLGKEYRTEINDWDYRLPGGKVFETFKEYNSSYKSEIQVEEALKAAVFREAREEVGIIVKSFKLLYKDIVGASVYWDLYFFEINDFEIVKEGQNLEPGEIIEPEWFTVDEVLDLCYNNKIKESRSLGVLLKYIHTNYKRYE